MMKKILSVLLVLAMVLSMSFAAAEAADMTGEWYAALYGIPLTLTLNEDGTYSMDMSAIGEEEPTEGTWELTDGNVIMDKDTEQETSAPYDAETNTFTVQEMFVFGREPVEVFTPAAVRADAAKEEFNGEWAAVQVSIFGMTIDPADAGMDMGLTIADDSISMSLAMGGEPEVTEGLPVTYADGCLSFGAEGEAAYSIYLLEDGMMQVDFDFAGETASFFMQKAE